MLVNQGIFDQLIEFGIEPVLAREAAKRYHTVEAAADWCFGSGANVGVTEPFHILFIQGAVMLTVGVMCSGSLNLSLRSCHRTTIADPAVCPRCLVSLRCPATS